MSCIMRSQLRLVMALWIAYVVASNLTLGRATEPELHQNVMSHHPTLDFDEWSKIYPRESFAKPDGEIITSPSHLCEVEFARDKMRSRKPLGTPVPVDIFLWSSGQPKKPYLTKLGGTPYRESSRPWPRSDDGKPYTFVAQFCFADSRNIVSNRLPNDVMLIFFKDSDSYKPSNQKAVQIEWNSVELSQPSLPSDCPEPSFTVPQLSGVRYRMNEYPDSEDLFFESEDEFPSGYLLAVTQSTKIGRETFYIQNDVREEGDELICALSSFHPSEEWPLVDMKSLPKEPQNPNGPYEWGKYRMMLSDVGCMYFVIDKGGSVSWHADSY
jgi:hypothetical protein